VGRNHAYKTVVLHEPIALGKFVNVRVTDAHGGYLTGRTAQSISDKR